MGEMQTLAFLPKRGRQKNKFRLNHHRRAYNLIFLNEVFLQEHQMYLAINIVNIINRRVKAPSKSSQFRKIQFFLFIFSPEIVNILTRKGFSLWLKVK
jgi:hypothetical protein